MGSATLWGMRPLLVLTIALAALTSACSGGGLPSPVVDDGGLPDAQLSGCTAWSECECRAHAECTAVTEACYCPPGCGSPDPQCLCGGGRYFGCAPVASHCGGLACLPAQPPTGPDGRGCYACGTATSCAEGRAAILGNCRQSEALLFGLRCDKNPTCVLGCMQKLAKCDDVGCAFCATCDCAANTPFATCVFACQQ